MRLEAELLPVGRGWSDGQPVWLLRGRVMRALYQQDDRLRYLVRRALARGFCQGYFFKNGDHEYPCE